MEIKKILQRLKDNNKLEPYIRYIRFPYYRNLEPGLKIDFTYPLTAIVGQNGTNKSSILRAIYGCPKDYNVGNFWFSTDLDPITEEKGRPRFIYSYYQPEANRNVEVIKTRIQRNYKTKNETKARVNPDYWEPSRPLISDGMEKMPDKLDIPGRTKTRWELMTKEVIFMDFRSEISAFDKYFYHGDLKQTLLHNTKQDYIRSKAKHLRHAVDTGIKTKKMYRGKKEQIISNVLLHADQVSEISKILGREYVSIRVITHRFFKKVGESVILSSGEFEYSEAFAGSGEFAVVMLVYKVGAANDSSLVILDEPEVSLHPGAQERLVAFLKNQIKEKKHQVILGTHSPFIIKSLPPEAIKTLYNDPVTNKIRATERTRPEEAFFHLGIESQSDRTIIVEDKLAAETVKKALRRMGQAVFESFNVRFYPGGASVLLGDYLPAYSLEGRRDCLFLVDGDQAPKRQSSLVSEIENADISLLDDELDRVLGRIPTFRVDGGTGGTRDDQLREAKIKALKYANTYISYLPDETPEAFIWNNLQTDSQIHNTTGDGIVDYKKNFQELTQAELGKEPFEDVSSDEIFSVQKRHLALLPDELLDDLRNAIDQFLENE